MAEDKEFLETVGKWAKLYFFQSLTEFFNYLKCSELSLLQGYALTYLLFKGPITISDLCEHMMVSPGAASQLVDRLEKLDMVGRISDPNDRRVRNFLCWRKVKNLYRKISSLVKAGLVISLLIFPTSRKNRSPISFQCSYKVLLINR